MEVAAKRFFATPHFAVVGASQDRSKFGYKIFAWYHTHSLPVTPINPNRPIISLPSRDYSTIPSVTALQEPGQTALSFLTPPEITRSVLIEAKRAGISSVWLQPGSYDDEGLMYAKDNFANAVGGSGWCVLVDGENSLKVAGREFSRQKL